VGVFRAVDLHASESEEACFHLSSSRPWRPSDDTPIVDRWRRTEKAM